MLSGAEYAVSFYNKLPKKGKPMSRKEWTLLSTVFLQQGNCALIRFNIFNDLPFLAHYDSFRNNLKNFFTLILWYYM